MLITTDHSLGMFHLVPYQWQHKSVIYRKCWKICLRKTTHHQWSDMISSFSLQASHIIRLVPTSPSINMSLRGEVNYRDHLSTQQRLFLDLTVHITDLRSFVIFHNRVSLCVWKLACQKVRMWLCHHLRVTPPPSHHLQDVFQTQCSQWSSETSSQCSTSLLLQHSYIVLTVQQFTHKVTNQVLIIFMINLQLFFVKNLSLFKKIEWLLQYMSCSNHIYSTQCGMELNPAVSMIFMNWAGCFTLAVNGQLHLLLVGEAPPKLLSSDVFEAYERNESDWLHRSD